MENYTGIYVKNLQLRGKQPREWYTICFTRCSKAFTKNIYSEWVWERERERATEGGKNAMAFYSLLPLLCSGYAYLGAAGCGYI